jgi:hypothetical protein
VALTAPDRLIWDADQVPESRTLLLPPPRLERWVANFAARHGAPGLTVAGGELHGRAADGSHFEAALPFGASYDGPAEPAAFAAASVAPQRWGVLLVRKGGFAVARLTGDRIAEHKIGQRHVLGRTKAGGQSQQRFARRRDNQARQAYQAAADHAARILGPLGAAPLVTGGDHAAVDAVLADLGRDGQPLAGLTVVPPFLAVPDPRRSVLDAVIADACSVRMSVTNA